MCSKSQIGFCQMSVQQRQIGEHLDRNRAFTTADFRTELPKIMVPTLNIQRRRRLIGADRPDGKKDSAAHFRIVSSRWYEGAPRGLIFTPMDQLNDDLLAVARGQRPDAESGSTRRIATSRLRRPLGGGQRSGLSWGKPIAPVARRAPPPAFGFLVPRLWMSKPA
jgi:hypothetical protein